MNRRFFLFAEFGANDIPLEAVAEKYFSHDKVTVAKWARHKKYPFETFRAGGQKSQWMVSIQALGDYLDKVERESKAA